MRNNEITFDTPADATAFINWIGDHFSVSTQYRRCDGRPTVALFINGTRPLSAKDTNTIFWTFTTVNVRSDNPIPNVSIEIEDTMYERLVNGVRAHIPARAKIRPSDGRAFAHSVDRSKFHVRTFNRAWNTRWVR